MIEGMQRFPLKSVSPSLPVLVPCRDRKPDGGMDVSGPGQLLMERPVRIFTDEDLLRTGKEFQRLAGAPTKKDWSFLCGVKLLQRANETEDSRATREAYQLLMPFFLGKTKLEIWPHLLASSANSGNPSMFLPRVVTYALRGARLVYWHTPGLTRKSARPKSGVGPAIYCPNYRTAIAVKMMMGSIRICLRCHSAFLPERAKQTCCSIRCTEAYRLARWRERKRAEKKALRSKRRGEGMR